jgi:hypothetical protein
VDIDYFYDKFVIRMKDMHVFLSDTSTHWHKFSDSEVDDRSIIKRFNIDCDLLLLKVPTDELPAVRVCEVQMLTI